MSSVLLSTAYLPNLKYLSQLVNSDDVVLEYHEYYVKQSQRNRCDILSSTGTLRLSIPLVQQADKEIISQKRISYAEKWQHQHWRTITTAYKNSAYFEFFEHEFKPFYETEYEFLFEYNLEIIKTVLNILRVKKEIKLTSQFELNPINTVDFRKINYNELDLDFNEKPYYQVFADKLGFTANLSCLDALFNVGLETKNL